MTTEALKQAAPTPDALALAAHFEMFTKCGHQTADGVPLHLAAAAELRRQAREIEALRAEIARLEKRRPLDAAEMREFIGSNFCSVLFFRPGNDTSDLIYGGSVPDENDEWVVTTHDLLSSFQSLEDWQRPALATEPAPVPEAGG